MTNWVGAGSAAPKSANIFANTGVTLRSKQRGHARWPR